MIHIAFRRGLFRGLILAAGSLTGVCAGTARAEEYPRAAVAATQQHLATALDETFDAWEPALALFGPLGEFEIENTVGLALRGLGAFARADAHWARAQELARRSGDDMALADIESKRGEIALTIGDYARVETIADDMLRIAQRAQLRWAEATAEEYVGVLDRRRGKLDTSLGHAQRALDLQRELGNESASATVLSNLGTLARDRGDFAKALEYFLQVLPIRERIGDRLELTLRNIALIYRDLGDEAATRDYFEKALVVARARGTSSDYAAVLGTYAGYLADLRDFKPALAAANEALAIERELGNRQSIGFDLLHSGRALLGLGRAEEATPRLNDALAIGRALEQREIMARSLLTLAEASLARGDRKHAHALLNETLASPQAADNKLLLVQAYALHEHLASADGNNATALDYAHKQAALRAELLGTSANRRLSALEGQYARAAAEQKLALVTKDNQLQSARLGQEQLQRRYGLATLGGLSVLLALLAWRFFGVRRLNRALAQRNEEIETKRAALAEANHRLERQTEQLYHAAITDSLTGVFNRGQLMRQLDARFNDCVRDGRELAVLLIDFDHFKQVNDKQGHLFGDRILIAGVQTLREWIEPDDLLGRYGGEEFIVAFSGRDADKVRTHAERLREKVAQALASVAPQLDPRATISIGVALLSQLPQPQKLVGLIDAADQAVYAAKAAGRNRVKLVQVA
ncbi:MAG: diguanylate cyclase [Gammaproteobacteria bacterium]|nr:MAG: diguanylate cyclase [Gammaproteobacteria bacterium]